MGQEELVVAVLVAAVVVKEVVVVIVFPNFRGFSKNPPGAAPQNLKSIKNPSKIH